LNGALEGDEANLSFVQFIELPMRTKDDRMVSSTLSMVCRLFTEKRSLIQCNSCDGIVQCFSSLLLSFYRRSLQILTFVSHSDRFSRISTVYGDVAVTFLDYIQGYGE
jgi:hypothetical protein